MDNINCPCSRTECERHGNCYECMNYHHNKKYGKKLTRCEKLENKQRKRSDRKIKRRSSKGSDL